MNACWDTRKHIHVGVPRLACTVACSLATQNIRIAVCDKFTCTFLEFKSSKTNKTHCVIFWKSLFTGGNKLQCRKGTVLVQFSINTDIQSVQNDCLADCILKLVICKESGWQSQNLHKSGHTAHFKCKEDPSITSHPVPTIYVDPSICKALYFFVVSHLWGSQ